jgi:transcriptional regulator of arginine metabolism
MSFKLKRQNRIKELLNDNFISNQEELSDLLKQEDILVTQATLSRDFAELGVVRTNTEKGIRYILDSNESGKQIARLIGFEILDIDYNESLVIVRTLAGRASGVAHYIDRLNREEIIGTVGGVDTVIVIPNSHKNIRVIIDLIKQMMSELPSK